ncbi:MAG TPA: cobalt ECF transporter T component CbiQ [Anaerolineales bacterium]|nr:cobalt ECF transporter T component CbiQ [Anaerolineales bacterium]
MHFDLADQYHPRSSFLHRLDPRVKVVIVIAFILAAGLMPVAAWGGFLGLWLLALVASLASGLGVTFALRRSYVALPFVLVAIPLLFTVPGQPLFTMPILGWTASVEGTQRFLTLLLRAWIAIQAAILLTAVTPFPDILWALRSLRLPRLLVATIGFMFRYLFVLADETTNMLRARSARSARGAGSRRPSIVWQARVAGNMVGSLFLRALERSERVHAAMLARGYSGEIPALARRAMSRSDWLAAAAAVLILTGLTAWAHTG